MIDIPESDDALLAECEVQTFRSGGKGGQHVNKTETGVRLIHTPTGTVVSSTDERSQYRNKTIALMRLRQKLEEMNVVKPERIATKKPESVKQRESDEKRRQSRKKNLRKPPEIDYDDFE